MIVFQAVPLANASESRNTLATKYDHVIVYVGESLYCLFFFFGDSDWLDQRWTRPMLAEVGARVTWGWGVGFGVVPAWLTFKTKPSGCSQASYTECRRISRYSLRPKIWPTRVLFALADLFRNRSTTTAYPTVLRFIRKYTRT